MFKARRPNLTIRPAIARLSEFICRFWHVRIPRANPLSLRTGNQNANRRTEPHDRSISEYLSRRQCPRHTTAAIAPTSSPDQTGRSCRAPARRDPPGPRRVGRARVHGPRGARGGGRHPGRDGAPCAQTHLDPLAARLVEGAVLEVGRHRADAHRHRSEGRHRAPAGAGPECRMTTEPRRSSAAA